MFFIIHIIQREQKNHKSAFVNPFCSFKLEHNLALTEHSVPSIYNTISTITPLTPVTSTPATYRNRKSLDFDTPSSSTYQEEPTTTTSELQVSADMESQETDKSLTGAKDAENGELVRKNSVRARANMFQQLQKQPATPTNTTTTTTTTTSSFTNNAHEESSAKKNGQQLLTLNEPITPNNVVEEEEIGKSGTSGKIGIARSRSGFVGVMPLNLQNELQARLNSSTGGTVSNLRKSATTDVKSAAAAQGFSALPQHPDTVNLVRNLAHLGDPQLRQQRFASVAGADVASTSEGESSGGREINEIIKSSAAARRRKLNDGNSKSEKSNSPIVPTGGVPILPPITGFIKLRHVVPNSDKLESRKTESSSNNSNNNESKDKEDQEKPNSTKEDETHRTVLPVFLRGGITRSSTQVMGPDQRTITITEKSTIADRLAALQKRGEDDWRKRVSQKYEVDDVPRENLVNETITLAHSLSEKSLQTSPLIPINIEGGKVSDRLGKLKVSSENWKNRIEQSDAAKFTIAAKLQEHMQPGSEYVSTEPPTNNGVRKDGKCIMQVFSSENRPLLGLAKSASMMVPTTNNNYLKDLNEQIELQFQWEEEMEQKLQRSQSLEESEIKSESRKSSLDSAESLDQENNLLEKKESIEKNANETLKEKHTEDDKAFEIEENGRESKINKESVDKTVNENLNEVKTEIGNSVGIDVSDFDAIKPTVRLTSLRHIGGPKGRRSVRNPLKSLAARKDVRNMYSEMENSPTISERIQHLNTKSRQKSEFSAEALAGLASVENFSSVSLKSALLPINIMLLPYKPKMLIHIKGRSHVQTRLVQPNYRSLNRGDCFILVTTDKLFSYAGAYANVIETSLCRKLCASILEHKDLGCQATKDIELMDDKPKDGAHWQEFWRLLEKPDNCNVTEAGTAEEDEQVEMNLIKTNRVYEYDNDTLRPLKSYWGCLPKYKMLESKAVLVFDFGSEVYVWNGKNARVEHKRAAIKLAQEYFDNPLMLDYTSCALNPLNYVQTLGMTDKPLKKLESRGDWSILGKISQNLETALFKHKFADWPEYEREALEVDYSLKRSCFGIDPLSGKELYIGSPYTEPNVILENASLGRGNAYYDTDSMRHFEIVSKTINKWHVDEFNYGKTNGHDIPHFYSAENYIIRWIYMISVTVRELNGNVSKRVTVGRDRCVYYCWQGLDASANEKGVAALLTVELDKEKGAQLRVTQGEESTAFVRLFTVMFVHYGSKKDCFERRNEWRLYQLIGNMVEECMLLEVICDANSLRSRSSMILINGSTGEIYIWHGCKSALHTRKMAIFAGAEILKQKSTHFFTTENLKLVENEEGYESVEFKKSVSYVMARSYGTLLLEKTKKFDYTPRLFHFSSLEGAFTSTEILYPLRTKEFLSPYPFQQATIYTARQPSAFMVDDGDTLWLWLGWWPKENSELSSSLEGRASPSSDNRAGEIRWAVERRAALQTVLSYWRAKFGDNDEEEFHGIKGFVVWAGLEPIEFKSLFPMWSDHGDVHEISLADGRSERTTHLHESLKTLTTTSYPLSVLKERPLPEGIDPTHLEWYLNENEFHVTFGMSRAEFEGLPMWKKTKLKKENQIF